MTDRKLIPTTLCSINKVRCFICETQMRGETHAKGEKKLYFGILSDRQSYGIFLKHHQEKYITIERFQKWTIVCRVWCSKPTKKDKYHNTCRNETRKLSNPFKTHAQVKSDHYPSDLLKKEHPKTISTTTLEDPVKTPKFQHSPWKWWLEDFPLGTLYFQGPC